VSPAGFSQHNSYNCSGLACVGEGLRPTRPPLQNGVLIVGQAFLPASDKRERLPYRMIRGSVSSTKRESTIFFASPTEQLS
jgi:hypothetical protein